MCIVENESILGEGNVENVVKIKFYRLKIFSY